jgi:hypothetical protein
VEQDQVKLFSGMLHRNGAVVGQTKVGDDASTCELNSTASPFRSPTSPRTPPSAGRS